MSLVALLRCAGVSMIGLALLHAVFWRALHWHQDLQRVTALTRRVFVVHTIVIAAMLFGMGTLSLMRPELFTHRSDWARVVLSAIVTLWVARLLAQPLIFNPVMTEGWAGSRVIHAGATLLWLSYALVYGAALLLQLDIPTPESLILWPPDSLGAGLRLAIAAVWIIFGLVFKLLDLVPRHRRIVARVIGEPMSRLVTVLVALGETGIGLWLLRGQYPLACAAVQTLAIVCMNALELRYARELLLAPRGMLLANTVLLTLVWYVALG